MGCKLVLNYSDGKTIKEESIVELGELHHPASIEEIAEIIAKLPTKQISRIYKIIDTSLIISFHQIEKYNKELKENKKTNRLVPNYSLSQLGNIFPETQELINLINRLNQDKNLNIGYNILYALDVYRSGKRLKGRTVSGGQVIYVLSNKYDVEKFIKTERKRLLIELYLNGNTILEDSDDNYLQRKYKNKLDAIVNKFKKELKVLESTYPEFAGQDTKTIKHLLIDFLYNREKYSTNDNSIIVLDGKPMSVPTILHNFIRELNKDEVILEDTRSALSDYLQNLNWNRTEFGKKEFYKALTIHFKEELDKRELTLDKFIEMKDFELNALLKGLFKDDIIMRDYEVIGVSETKEEKRLLTSDLVTSFLKKVIENKNKKVSDKSLHYTIDLVEKFDSDLIETFLAGFNKATYLGIERELLIERASNKEWRLFYHGKHLNNSDKILLKRKGSRLKESFLFGYDNTTKVFSVVDESNRVDIEDKVINGRYKGFYIYVHTDEKNQDTYIVSSSLISPELYDPKKFSSLRDAKLSIEGMNRFMSLKNLSKIELNYNLTKQAGVITVPFIVNSDQTVEVIDVPILPTYKLPNAENDLMSKRLFEVVLQYKKYGIDISELTPEAAAVFIHKISREYGYTLGTLNNFNDIDEFGQVIIPNPQLISEINEKLANGLALTKDEKQILKLIEVRHKINNLILELIAKLNAKKRQFYVYSSNMYEVNKKYERKIKLIDLDRMGITINSDGFIPEKINVGEKTINDLSPRVSKTKAFWTLKETLENDLLKELGVKIEITDSDLLLELNKTKNLFDNDYINSIRAFIHTDEGKTKIYINQTNASLDDLVHELMHVVLQSIRAIDIKNSIAGNETNNYLKIILFFASKESDSTFKYIKKLYPGMSYVDLLEEVAVRKIVKLIESSTLFYNGLITKDNEDDIFTLIQKTFMGIRNDVLQAFTLSLSNEDIGFTSKLYKLLDSNLSELETDRKITNLIKSELDKGEDGKIKEICK